ncbi:MAG: hypothetical protein Q8M16_17490, partial [Pirellulaceae bacterium]|nr:hypothetical protein [Pirellulaceae bacterium]
MCFQFGSQVSFMCFVFVICSPWSSGNSWQDSASTTESGGELDLHPLEDVWQKLSTLSRRQIDQAVLAAYPAISEQGSSDL